MSTLQNDEHVEDGGNLTVEDFDALLEFPFQEYASTSDAKPEAFKFDLPKLGSYGSLVLNKDIGPVSSFEIPETEDSTKDPEVLKECLSLNHILQQKFVATLSQIQLSLDKNLAKQAEMHEKLKEEEKIRVENEGKMSSARPLALFTGSYFRDVRGMVPPDNEDTIAKLRNHDVTAYLLPPKPWSIQEKSQLVNGVGANALNYLLKQHKAKRDYLRTKLSDKNVLDEERKVLRKKIKAIESKIFKESQRDFKSLVEDAKGNIDWMTISATDLEGKRSEEDCEMMWTNYLSIFVNKRPFTRDEDIELRKLAEKYEGKNWDVIAERLNTGRTAVQCFERYQTRLNPKLTKKFWKPSEDEKLLEIVESVRIGNFIPWNKVCCYMEGRTRHQIYTRYERTLNKTMEKGPWTKFDDALLLACIHRFGSRWTKIKELFFPRRNSYLVRERYVNTLEPSIKVGNWSLEEDRILAQLIKQHGFGKWSKIAREMPGRTDNMCLVRMQRLKKFLREQIVGFDLTPEEEDEFNKEFEDPAYIANNLPEDESAPSKLCVLQNKKMKIIQLEALETLRIAVQNIKPSLDENINLESMDLSSVSLQTLEKIKVELNRMRYCGDYENLRLPYYSKKKLRRRRLREAVSKRFLVMKDDITSDEEFGSEPDYELFAEVTDEKIVLNELEKSWLEKVLESKFQEEICAVNLAPIVDSSKITYSRRQILEYNLFQEYLRKGCSLTTCESSDDDEDKYVYADINYSVTVPDVVRHFVQPNISEGQNLVLAPNCTTLLGLDRIMASRARLQRTASFVGHSMPYIRYLTGITDQQPQCIKCKDSKSVITPEMFNTVLYSMKSKLLVVERNIREAAMNETRFVQLQEENCICKELAKSKAQVELLTQRFLSMFLWPFLLSSSGLSKKQDLMIKPPPKRYPFTRTGMPPRKRKSSESPERNTWKPSRVEPEPVSSEPVRRSKRHCVLRRKSFSYPDDEDTESAEDQAMES